MLLVLPRDTKPLKLDPVVSHFHGLVKELNNLGPIHTKI